MKIKKLFIANRGEIAARIARSAKLLDIHTVAIKEGKNPKQFLTGLVDQFIEVEQETLEMYLNGSLMIQLAQSVGCDALHPGFGFLSENADFCRSVTEAGITWIGPSHLAIAKMASKDQAREWLILRNTSYSWYFGINFHSSDHEKIKEKINQDVGYPLLIKASYGGGGKGMRICEDETTLLSQLERATSEAISSFGNGSLIVEKYLPDLRHVEVQIIGDQDGNIVAIGDRDCSIQRRHQKIIEECPAWDLSDNLKSSMAVCSIRLAKEVNYVSAGTVEFLVEGNNFYFLEMNTRLQVEHPVTEEVYGIDLVASYN